MLQPKTLIVGVVAFALGAAGARLLPSGDAQQAEPITVTMAGDEVVVRNNTTDRHYAIVAWTSREAPPRSVSNDTGEVRIPAADLRGLAAIRITEQWSFRRDGTAIPCRPDGYCPEPPPCPPADGLPCPIGFYQSRLVPRVATPVAQDRDR